jgi:hypothetical protein
LWLFPTFRINKFKVSLSCFMYASIDVCYLKSFDSWQM